MSVGPHPSVCVCVCVNMDHSQTHPITSREQATQRLMWSCSQQKKKNSTAASQSSVNHVNQYYPEQFQIESNDG